MIIKFLSDKDTFVTNMNTDYNEGIKSNFGKASTLDLFKLYNENKNSYSWAKFEFTGELVADDDSLTLEDASGNIATFIIKSDVNTNDGTIDPEGHIIVGTLGLSQETYAEQFAIVVNSINTNNTNNKTLNITAYAADGQLVLIQNIKGKLGDTEFTLPVNMTHVINANINKFCRRDYSCILIKFNIDDLLEKWALNNDVEAFNNVYSEVILKDVSTGIQKPKDYTLELYKIKDSFIEGIGKDIKNFSDSYVTNFVDLNENTTWSIPGILTSREIGDSLIDSVTVSEGDEDIKFNISSIINDYINGADRDNFGFLIKFSDANLFDSKTYFAKRVGSRHLVNKKFVPCLDVLIDDSSYITNTLYNKQVLAKTSGSHYFYVDDVILPANYDKLNLELSTQINSEKVILHLESLTQADITNAKVKSFQGEEVADRLSISIDYMDFITTEVLNYISTSSSKKIKINQKIFLSGPEAGDPLEAPPEFLLGNDYFYLDFDSQSNLEENFNKNLYVTTKFDKELNGNNSAYIISTHFINTKRNYTVSKIPLDLVSENLSDVYYQIYDVDTGEILYDFKDTDLLKHATKMKFDGVCYKANVFISELYKNKRINFKFKFTDSFNNTSSFIENKNMSFKVL
jgi:hypothetical protein